MARGSSVEPKNLEGAKSFLFISYNINASVVSHMNPRGGGGGGGHLNMFKVRGRAII